MLLKPKSDSKTKPFTIRLPGETASQLAELRKLAEQRGLVLDVNDVCVKAIQSALKQARSELT